MDDTELKVKLEWAELKASISKTVQLVKRDPRRLIGNVLAVAAVIALSYHHPIYALGLALMAVNLWTARVSITALESGIVSDNAEKALFSTEKEKNDILELWEKMKNSEKICAERRAVERREIPGVEPVSENFVRLEAELLRDSCILHPEAVCWPDNEIIKNLAGGERVVDLDYKAASRVKTVLTEHTDTEVSDKSLKTTKSKSKKKKD